MSISFAPIYDALKRGDWQGARTRCRSVLADAPDSPAAHHALGMAFCGEGDFDAAVDPLERARALDPDNPQRSRDVSIVYGRLGRWRDVLRTLTPIVGSLDERTQALYLAAAVHTGESPAALAVLEMEGAPAAAADTELLCEYGRALAAAGRMEEAETALLRCTSGASPIDRAHDELATLYQMSKRGDLALEHSAEYVRRNPDSGYARLRLAVALALRGRLDESRAARLAALRLGFSRAVDWSSALKLMLCDRFEDGVTIAAACAMPFRPRPDAPAPRPARRSGRLRIGYLSGEFHLAPAHYFLSPFILNHDRSRVEVFLYDTSDDCAAHAAIVARQAEQARPAGRLSDDDLASMILTDDVDVLVELGTHFPGNRLQVMNRRVAPVQASLPNCPSTTGCPEVDYLLTDWWTSPEGSEREYTERLHRLAAGYLIYAPPECPTPPPVAALRNGFVTFGLIQQLPKIGADVWDAVAGLLRATPRSQLLMHNGDGELSRPDSATVRFLRAQLEARDLDPGRMRIVGMLPHREHLDLLGEIDIAIDTWPFTGTTTTCECLWMGVPVVTKAGASHASRVSAGLLARLGLDALVAGDAGSYVDIATRLAADLDALMEYRATLRERAVQGGLTDGRALAREMESAYDQWAVAAGRR